MSQEEIDKTVECKNEFYDDDKDNDKESEKSEPKEPQHTADASGTADPLAGATATTAQTIMDYGGPTILCLY